MQDHGGKSWNTCTYQWTKGCMTLATSARLSLKLGESTSLSVKLLMILATPSIKLEAHTNLWNTANERHFSKSISLIRAVSLGLVHWMRHLLVILRNSLGSCLKFVFVSKDILLSPLGMGLRLAKEPHKFGSGNDVSKTTWVSLNVWPESR